VQPLEELIICDSWVQSFLLLQHFLVVFIMQPMLTCYRLNLVLILYQFHLLCRYLWRGMVV